MEENISKETNKENSSRVNLSPAERIISSTIGGFLLYKGFSAKGGRKAALIVSGATLLFRGVAGYSVLYNSLGKARVPRVAKNINIRTTLIVNKPRKEVYAFWREIENLPLFLTHIEKVEKIDEKYSVWKAKIPGNLAPVSWTAEIVKDEEDSHLGWSSIPDSTIHNAGKVEFSDAGDGQSTELNITITYHPPFGVVGAGIANLLNPLFENIVREDVLNFKEFMETGHLPQKKS